MKLGELLFSPGSALTVVPGCANVAFSCSALGVPLPHNVGSTLPHPEDGPMIRRRCLGAAAFVATTFIAGCDNQPPTVSPTELSTFATSTADGSKTAPSSFAAERTGTLHMTKACPEYTGLRGSFCTIASSDLKQMPAGSRVVYAGTLTAGKLDSDLYLDPPGRGNNRAFGHVFLDLTATPPHAVITFSGGTGKFTHFNATIQVTRLVGVAKTWNWDGQYSFQP
ncbi:MAG: hypothetical protein M3Z10_14875 [Gemmatimonadota bacterium]|nr:hypothetical protein [Gemmatimonadota bacterium]